MYVDSVSGAGSDASRCLGSSDESLGDWRSYTSTTQEAKKPKLKKGRRFRTGCLALNGQDASLLPTPRKVL